MSLFIKKNFISAAGLPLDFKIDCDDLSWSDYETLAYMASKLIGPFGNVYGVPSGGIEFAIALIPYKTPNHNGNLIVDDVYTTGKSLDKFIVDNRIDYSETCVIFNRSKNPNINAIFHLNSKLSV